MHVSGHATPTQIICLRSKFPLITPDGVLCDIFLVLVSCMVPPRDLVSRPKFFGCETVSAQRPLDSAVAMQVSLAGGGG